MYKRQRVDDPAQKAVQLSQQEEFMAAARHFIADHLLNTELQLLRSVTAKDPVVRAVYKRQDWERSSINSSPVMVSCS